MPGLKHRRPVRPGHFAAALAVFALAAGHGRAEDAATPCVLDKCLSVAPAPAGRAGPGPLAPGAFDFYVLALSWSPGFCDTGGEARGGAQCAAGARLGFVVHGLWPQNARGYPSNCDAGANRSPPRAALDRVRGLYPDEGLARHEWRMHGTCTGLSPSDYFDQVRRAREAVAIPQALQAPGEPQTFAPRDLVRAFVGSNPGLRADAVAVTCRQGELEEVRLCLAKDLRGFTSCPEVARASCRAPNLTVMPPA